jgi:hypothetical protein
VPGGWDWLDVDDRSHRSVGAGFELRGEPTILERLVGARRQYIRALEAADRAWAEGRLDVSILQRLLDRLFRRQLKGAGFGPG